MACESVRAELRDVQQAPRRFVWIRVRSSDPVLRAGGEHGSEGGQGILSAALSVVVPCIFCGVWGGRVRGAYPLRPESSVDALCHRSLAFGGLTPYPSRQTSLRRFIQDTLVFDGFRTSASSQCLLVRLQSETFLFYLLLKSASETCLKSA